MRGPLMVRLTPGNPNQPERVVYCHELRHGTGGYVITVAEDGAQTEHHGARFCVVTPTQPAPLPPEAVKMLYDAFMAVHVVKAFSLASGADMETLFEEFENRLHEAIEKRVGDEG